MSEQRIYPPAKDTLNQRIQGPSTLATLGHLLFSKSERATYYKLRTKYTSLRNPKEPARVASPNLSPPGISTSASTTPCLPLALPQLSPEATAPILRALPTILQILTISPVVLLNIIDAYNLATTAEPSLQVSPALLCVKTLSQPQLRYLAQVLCPAADIPKDLDAAAAVIGLIPEPHVQLASHVTSVVAAVGQEEVSKARGNVLLERVNVEILANTGWKTETVKGKELARVLGVERLPVMLALRDHEEDDEVCNSWSNHYTDEAHSEGRDKMGTTSAERRVQALVSAGLTAAVTFDVPAPSEQTKKMQRFLAKEQGKEYEKYRKEQQDKREKKQKKRQEREAKLVGNQEELEAILRKERRKEEERERKKMEKLTWFVFRKTE